MDINQDDFGIFEKEIKPKQMPKYIFVFEDKKDEYIDYKDVLTEIVSDRIRRKLNDISDNGSVEK